MEHSIDTQSISTFYREAVRLEWNLVIAVRSLSIAHRIGSSKAFLVIVATILVFFVALPFLLALLSGVIISLLL